MKYTLTKKEGFSSTCACGCGGALPSHRYYGRMRVIYGACPRFLPGHVNKTIEGKAKITGRPDVRTAWVLAQDVKICLCGCGKEITVRTEHKDKGIPEYALGHSPNSRDNRLGASKGVRGRKFSDPQRIQIVVKCQFRCALCNWGGQTSAHLLEFDHVVPVHLGGKTTVENGQALCHPCHTSKTGRERAQIALRNRKNNQTFVTPSRVANISKNAR